MKTKHFSHLFYSNVPKNIRLNSKHYFIMKITNERELQKIGFNHSSDIYFQNFMNFYQNFIKSILKNHILFWLLILLLHQIILHALEKIFWKEYKN